jgi:adenosylmethionine-8-amino-7-oxononanoate aminotransferase
MRFNNILPYTNHRRLQSSIGGAKSFSHGRGDFLVDTEGVEYLDASGGVSGNMIYGYDDSELAQIVAQQCRQLPFMNVHNWANSEAAETLNRRVKKLFLGAGFSLASSGTEAIEMAIYISHWIFKSQRRETKNQVMKLSSGYHGSSLSLKNSVIEAPQAGNFDANLLDTIISNVDRVGAEKLGCFVIEPIQAGQGGWHASDLDFYKNLYSELSSRHIHLIFDEVVTGFGRTDTLSYVQQNGLDFDMVVFGKAMGAGYAPISMTLLSPALFQEFMQVDDVFNFGHTMAYNPVGCRVAATVIDRLQQMSHKSALGLVGDQLSAILRSTFQDLGTVSSFGALHFFKSHDPGLVIRVKRALYKDKIIMVGGKNFLHICPALNWDQATVDLLHEKLTKMRRNI